jgi:inner membrane protein
MPSPIGHALAGILTVWVVDCVPGRRTARLAAAHGSWWLRAGTGLTLAGAVLAAAPDLDLLFAGHRTVTHSVGAVALVGAAAALVAARLRWPVTRVALTCAAAYGSHLLLDWMGVDLTLPYGLQALWPFSDRWFISGWSLFRRTERRRIFTLATMKWNAETIAQEIAMLAPFLAIAWLIRVKTLARLATEVPRGNHAPQ